MCGIVGIHGAQEDRWIAAMNERQRHREDHLVFDDRKLHPLSSFKACTIGTAQMVDA